MAIQDSTFNTAHVMDNEIVKANDFEFAFEKIAENVSKATQMILESNQDFVINGKVTPYQGMNVRVAPIYGVCKSSGIPFGCTSSMADLGESIGFEESSSGRVDILEVKGEWETYDNQQRAFNDPDTNVKTYQYVDTKKLMKPVYRVKKGVEGSSSAPEVDDEYVKLAEVVIRANNSTITASDIKNITADIAGLNNEGWTTQPAITYNIGYISDINERFRVAHNEDGSHKNDSIDSDMLDIGTGAKQVNGSILPIGTAASIPSQTTNANDTIYATISKIAAVITTIYNAYIKYGTYGFKGELSVSDLASSNTLTKPITIKAAGDGTAVIKVNGNAVLSIDTNGKLSTNGYTASSNNDIVTKVVTDAISTSLSNLATRVTNIENTLGGQEVYINKTLSTDRFTVASISIVAATTANITLSGLQTIDGVSLTAGQFVLVKNQTDAKNNGIYSAETSTWTRATDYNTPNKLKGKIFNIINGTSNGGKMYYTPTETFTNGGSFGSDNINFVEFIGSVAKLANKLVMRDSNGAAKVDITGNVTGNCSGSSGSCTGNAGSATKLANTVDINGLEVDGSDTRVNYGICSTAAATVEKVVDCTGFALVTGSEITVKFTVTNTAANPTLNVNSTGKKAIYYRGAAISAGYLAANRTYTFRYNGTQYELVGDLDTNTTYSVTSKTAAGLCPQLPNETTTTKFLRQDGSWVAPSNTTYSDMTGASSSAAGTHGLVPAPAAGKQGQYLRGDGTWNTPTNTTYSNFVKSGSTAAAGLVPAPSTTAGTTKFLCEDATWKVPAGAVSGVKGNSESTYRTGDVNITKANIGLGNVDNTTFRETALFGLFITTDTESLTAGTYKFSPTAPVGSTVLATGSVVRVTFQKALQSSVAISQVNFYYGGRDGAIKAARGDGTNGLVLVTSHIFSGGNYSSTYKNKVWDKYTTLDLMWTGTEWLVMSNPVLCSYFSDTQSYIVYANGLIEQRFTRLSGGIHNFLINYTQYTGALGSSTNGYLVGLYRIGSSPYSQFEIAVHSGYYCDVIFIGY